MNKIIPSIPGTSASRKQLYIGLIVVALIVVLVYLGGRQFVGKAIEAPITVLDTAGEAGILGTDVSGTTLSVGIGANIAEDSVAFEFELNYPAGLTPLTPLDTAAFVPDRDWGANAFKRVTQTGNTLKIEYATLDYNTPLTGAVELGEVKFSGSNLAAVQADDFTLSSVNVWDIPDGSTDDPVNLAPIIVAPSGEMQCTAVDANSCATFYNGNVDDKNLLCAYDTECLSRGFTTGGTGAIYNADLNLDTRYDGQDAQVIFGTRDAKNNNNCGAAAEGSTVAQSPCNYDRLYVCDDGSFRVTGLNIYNSGAAYVHISQTCPYTMTRS